MKKILLCIVLWVTSLHVNAGRIEYGNNIVIDRPVSGNLYLAGGTVTINAPVYGDLIVAGGKVYINDTIASDVLIAGGRVFMKGHIGGDFRCAAGSAEISRDIAGDLVVAGGKVIIDRGITVESLMMIGGDVEVNGNVSHTIEGRFAHLVVRGEVRDWVDIKGDEIEINGLVKGSAAIAAREIIIGPQAAFEKDVRYWDRAGIADFKQSVEHGKAIFDRSLRFSMPRWYFLGAGSFGGMMLYLAMGFVMILLVELLFKKPMKAAGRNFSEKSLKSLGWGLLFLVAMPLLIALIMITVIGTPAAVLLLLGYIITLVFSSVITSVVAANWLNTIYDKHWNPARITFVALGILILLKLLSLASYTGWAMILLVVCIAFGSIILSIGRKPGEPFTQG